MSDRVVLPFQPRQKGGVVTPAADPAPASSTPCIFDPDPAEDAPPPDPIGLSTHAFLHYAEKHDGAYIRTLGHAFFNQPDIPHFETYEGVKILMGQPIFQFLRAVHEDDLERAVSLMLFSGKTIRPKLNVPSFFFSKGSSDACFVTPAHLVRSTDMAPSIFHVISACGLTRRIPRGGYLRFIGPSGPRTIRSFPLPSRF